MNAADHTRGRDAGPARPDGDPRVEHKFPAVGPQRTAGGRSRPQVALDTPRRERGPQDASTPAAGRRPAPPARPTLAARDAAPGARADREVVPALATAARPQGGYDAELVEAVFALAGGLPVDQLAVAGDAATARAAHAALWMARLWGAQDGYACLCLGHGGHLTPSGRYQFADFAQAFHPWPRARARLLAQAMAAAASADVYVGVLLRARPSRQAGTALPGRVAWADVDGPWTAERAGALGRLAGRPVWQVRSGSGRHLYLPLDQPEPPEQLEAWNRRLAVLLDADAGWSETKLLRLPGTLNHKPAASGGRPAPVGWLW